MIDSDLLMDVVDQFGTPCFVYDFDAVRARVAQLTEAFGGRFAIRYAMKSNPNEAILRRMRNLVHSLDISSAGELNRALAAGWPPDQISFTGPAKQDFELHAAVNHRVAEVVVESVPEAIRLNATAERAGARQRILIRINPAQLPNGFGVGMAGKPSQFGIDEEDLDSATEQIRRLSYLDLTGFHIYAGTQCLRADVITQAYDSFATLFASVCQRQNLRPRKLIFGSGLGIAYHEGDEPLDLQAIALKVNPMLDRLREDARFRETDLVLETGRYLIGEAGMYLTRIISTKHSRGTEIRICDGGMNHHLAAAGHLGSVIPRNYRISKVVRGEANSPGSTSLARVDICGPLCTSIDILARSTMLPELLPGDILAIHCSGAYGPTASPLHFLSHRLPREVIIERLKDRVMMEDSPPKLTGDGTSSAGPTA